MKSRAILMLILALSVLFSSQAVAQDETGSSVVVLKFSTTDVDQELTDLFFLELHEAIRSHSEMHVAGTGEVTIQDLMLMGGCNEPSQECLNGLADFVEGDRVVFGSIARTDDTYTFNVSMFDFTKNRYMREVKDLTLSGNTRDLQSKLPVVAESLIHGDVGTLEVSIDGTGAARIFVNDVDKGRTPLSLTELPLGEVTVTAWGDDESEQSKTVLLRYGQSAEVTFAIDTPVVVAQESSSSTPYLISGIALAGVGVAGLVTATLGHLDLDRLNDNAAGLMASGQPSVHSGKAKLAEEIQSDMNTAQTMRVVGLSVGAVGIVAGTFLLIKAFTSGDSTDVAPSAAPAPQDVSQSLNNWRVAPSASGFGFSLGADF